MSNPLNSSDEKSYQYNGYGGWSTLSLSSANSSKHQASSYDSILEKLDQKIENIAQIARESEQRDKQIKEQYMSGCIDTLASRNSSTDSKDTEQILTGRRIPKSSREIYLDDAVGVGSNEQVYSKGSPLGYSNKTNQKKGLIIQNKDEDTQVEKLLDRVGQLNGQLKLDSVKHKDNDNRNQRKIFRLEDALREQQQQIHQQGSKILNKENQCRRESDYVFFSWSVYQECKEVYDKSAYVIFTRTDFEAVMESLGQKNISTQLKQQKIKGQQYGFDDSDKENQDNNQNRQANKTAIQSEQITGIRQKKQKDCQNQNLKRIQQNTCFKNGQIEKSQQPIVVLSTQQSESNCLERNQSEIKTTKLSLSPQQLINRADTRSYKSTVQLTTIAVVSRDNPYQPKEELYNGFKIIPKDQTVRAYLANQQLQILQINNPNSNSISADRSQQSQQQQQYQQQEYLHPTIPTTTYPCSTTFQSCPSPGQSSMQKNPMSSDALTFNQQEAYSIVGTGISATVTPFDQNYTCPSQSFHIEQRHTTYSNDQNNNSMRDHTNNVSANSEETSKSLRRESSITRLLKAKIIQRDHNHHSVDAPRSPISTVQNQAVVDCNNNNINSSNNSNYCRIITTPSTTTTTTTQSFNEQLTILSSPSSLPLKLKPHLPTDMQSLRHHKQSYSNQQLTPQLITMHTHKNSVSSHCSIPKPAILSKNNTTINQQGSSVAIMQRQSQDKQDQQVQQQIDGMKIIGIRKRSNYSLDRQITQGDQQQVQQQQQQQQAHSNYAKRQIQRAESTISFNHQDTINNTVKELNANKIQLPYSHSRQQQQIQSQNIIQNIQNNAATPNTLTTTTINNPQVLSMKPRCFSYDRLSSFQSSTIPNSKQPPYPSILS